MKSLWILRGYCALLLVGGFLGWKLGGSMASLISSGSSCVVLLAISIFVAKRKKLALILTIAVLAFLDTFFTYRWLSVGSMPAGIMAVASLIALLGFAVLAKKDFALQSKP